MNLHICLIVPDIKFALKVDTVNINTIQNYVASRNMIFGGSLCFSGIFKNCPTHITMNLKVISKYTDKNIQSVMDV